MAKNTIDAKTVASFFDRSVTKIKDQSGKIATRAENGYFYLPGRTGSQAFYLAPGETAQVYETAQRWWILRRARERARNEVVPETRRQIRNVENEIINYEATRAYYAKYHPKQNITYLENKLNEALGTRLSGNTPKHISDEFIRAVAQYQQRNSLMVDGQAGESTLLRMQWKDPIRAQEVVRQKDMTTREALDAVLNDTDYYRYLALKWEVSKAIERDVSGSLIEGGLAGIIWQNNNIKKFLDKKPAAEQKEIRAELDRLSQSYVIEDPGMLRKIFGARSQQNVRDVLNGSFVSKRRKSAVIETLSIAALSLVMSGGQSVSVLFGKIKTPFTIQEVPNPGRDVAAYVIYEMSAQELEWKREQAQEQVDYEAASASKDELKALKTRWDTQKYTLEYNALTQNGKKLDWRKPSHREAYLRLLRSQVFDNPQAGPIFKKFVSMVTSVTSFDNFARSYTLPRDPDVAKWIRAFYEGWEDAYGKKRKPADLQILWDMLTDRNKYIGASSMVRSQGIDQSTREHIDKYVQKWEKTPGNKKNPDSYGPPLENLRPHTVLSRFEEDSALTWAYIDKINQLSGSKISRDALLSAIRQWQVMEVTGINTGLRTNENTVQDKTPWKWEAFVIAVPVTTSRSGPWLQMIAIKPDCTNYVIGEFIPHNQAPEPDTINVKWRIPLLWNFRLRGGGRWPEKAPKEKRSKSVNRRTKTRTITEEKSAWPYKPTEIQSSPPGKPIPQAPKTSSTPGSNVNGNVPQSLPENVIPSWGEWGTTGSFKPSVDIPPSSAGAVWVGIPKPAPDGFATDPF